MSFHSKIILIITFFFQLLSCTNKTSNSTKESGSLLEVTKIVDGDTFYASDGYQEIKVRLIGVDAPESRKSARKEVHFFGKRSTEYLKSLIEGKKIRLEYDVDRYDQYGRTLAYVYREDGLFINAELIKNGYAMIMTVPPNIKLADKFLKLQEAARQNKKGLWGIEN